MSLSYSPLQVVSVLDPVIDLEDQASRKYAITKGGNQYTYKEYIATTVSNNSITWNCPPPSANTIVDRKMYVKIPIRLQFTGTVTGATGPSALLLNPGKDAFRQFALSSSCQMLQLTINGQPVQIPLSEVIHGLNRYNCGEEVLATEYSLAQAVYPDQSHDYNDLYGSINNPLGNFLDARQGLVAPRGAIPFTIVQNNSTSAIVDAVLVEPLFVSPAYYGLGDAAGFYNVNAIQVTMNFLNNGFRAWSHAQSVSLGVYSTITNIQMQFSNFTGGDFSYDINAQPAILFKYITPSNQMHLSPVNMPLTYPYFEVTDSQTALPGTLAPGLIKQYTSNNLQLNSIPRKIYMFLKRNNTQLQQTAIYPDVFYPIFNVNITLGNYTGQLSSATVEHLYEIALKNGYRGSFTQFKGDKVPIGTYAVGGATLVTEGSVLAIDCSTDLGLPDGICAGYQDQVNFQVTFSTINRYTAANGAEDPALVFHIVTVNEGSFVIPQINSAVKSLGIITAHDILNARVDRNIKYHDIVTVNGGSRGNGNFLTNIKDFAIKNAPGANQFLKDTKLISSALSVPNPYSAVTMPAAAVARTLGYGEGGDGGAVYDPSQDMENYGGRRMSKKHLAKRLMHI
jgi:hypothetical protein